MNQLEQLKRLSLVVADTGDLQSIARFAPQDATTNPSLILKAAQSAAFRPMLHAALQDCRGLSMADTLDRVVVQVGLEILRLIAGRVSSEVDARLSFDTPGTIARARKMVALYQDKGIATDRILVKIAATWEGIQAARVLAADGIATNLTLVFALPQAIACADAKVQLISPFVGRIYDWYKTNAGPAWDEVTMAGANDPGVQSVKQIYQYYKHHGIATEVMAASFRNVGQICALGGCDLLTISPALLDELQRNTGELDCALYPQEVCIADLAREPLSESEFRLQMNRNAMATEKLAHGIRQFEDDTLALEATLAQLLAVQ